MSISPNAQMTIDTQITETSKQDLPRVLGISAVKNKFLGILASLPDFLLLLTIFLPMIFRENEIDDYPRLCTEYYSLFFGMFFIISVQLQNFFSGRSLFSGASYSKTRIFVILFFVYLFFNSFMAFNPLPARKHLAAVLGFFLIAQSFLDWLEFSPKKLNRAIFFIGFAVAFQLGVGCFEYNGIPKPVDREYSSKDLISPVGGFFSTRAWGFICSIKPASGSKDKIYGTFNNQNFFAEFLILTVPLVVFSLFTQSRILYRLAIFLFLIPMQVFLYYINCRAAWIGLISAGVAVLLTFKSKLSNSRKSLFLLFCVISVSIALLASYFFIFSSPQKLAEDPNIEGRLSNWKVAFQLWLDHPIFGCGLGNYKLVSEDKVRSQVKSGKLPKIFSVARFFQVHNEVLQAFVEFGLIGGILIFLAFGLWTYETFHNQSLEEYKKIGLFWGIFGTVIAGQFGFPFHISSTVLFLLLFICIGISNSERKQIEPNSDKKSIFVINFLSIILLVLVLGTTFFRSIYPVYLGGLYERPTPFLVEKHHYECAEKAIVLADRFIRYRGDLRIALLECFVHLGKFREAAILFELSKKEGLPINSFFWVATSYALLGRFFESAFYFCELMKFYDDQSKLAETVARVSPKLEFNFELPTIIENLNYIGFLKLLRLF
ncbi:MAG: O-antigen ligase family protein [Candidatus Riflebacteria bacterium]|nr:O-antigen ligase family protein [Candidatus Riflebacteria bacterium]